jgi:hypothetical protein
MNPIKKIIIEETAKVLREVKRRKNVSEVKQNLFEAIKTADVVKNNPKKYKLAKKLVDISESKFINERTRLKEEHGPEDESEMAKAQLAAIIEKSNELYRMLEGVSHLEDWLQYKLSIAENYIDAVHGYMKYFNGGDEMESDEMFDDDNQWDDVEEEDFNDEDAEYYDEEDYEDFDSFDDFDVEDEYEDFDDDDEEFVV